MKFFPFVVFLSSAINFWINNPRRGPPFFDLIDTTVYLFLSRSSFPYNQNYSCSNWKDNHKHVSFSRKALVSWSDQQPWALGSFSSLNVGSQLRLIQEVLKTFCSVWGVERWKKGWFITFCNLTPVSGFWICFLLWCICTREHYPCTISHWNLRWAYTA